MENIILTIELETEKLQILKRLMLFVKKDNSTHTADMLRNLKKEIDELIITDF